MSGRILLRKTSLVDYPGCISAVIFFSGCNLRCPWCHNGELVLGGADGLSTFPEALTHIKKRCSVLGGVVLSGGEPCLYKELPRVIEEIKMNGLKVKLDTNGMFPSMLEELFREEKNRPDYIALDLKIAPGRYGELLPSAGEKGKDTPGGNLAESAALIRDSDIAHEYRTIVLPGAFITETDIEALSPLADNSPWYFRPFRSGNCLDPAWNSLEESAAEAGVKAKALADKARASGKNAIIP